jgi:hypothetical protein
MKGVLMAASGGSYTTLCAASKPRAAEEKNELGMPIYQLFHFLLFTFFFRLNFKKHSNLKTLKIESKEKQAEDQRIFF